MDTDKRYTVLAFVGDRDISKHTNSKVEAKNILKKLKDAAAVLGLMDVFRGEIHEVN